jgi:hypothetical protein
MCERSEPETGKLEKKMSTWSFMKLINLMVPENKKNQHNCWKW